MLEELKFVKGAVARKDFVPELTHFCIKNGYVTGYNGIISLRTKIDIELDVAPNALQFARAVDRCEETISLHVAKNQKLVISSGKFKANIDCLDVAKFPNFLPSGDIINMEGPLLPAMEKLSRFIAEDASRPWACGVLFKDRSAFATNNIVLAEYWLGYVFPRSTVIPHAAVRELLRIGKEPISIQVAENSMTFHYEGGSWLSTHLKKLEWPDISKILADSGDTQVALDDAFYDAVDKLVQFTDELDAVFLTPGLISTTREPKEHGASYTCEQVADEGCFNAKQLLLLRDVAKTIALSSYPRPAIFYGEKIRGAIIGIRL